MDGGIGEGGKGEAGGDRPACKARTWIIFKADWANVRRHVKCSADQRVTSCLSGIQLGRVWAAPKKHMRLVQNMLLDLGESDEDLSRFYSTIASQGLLASEKLILVLF